MGTFMNTNKKIAVRPVNSSNILELDVATTLSFYITERIQDTIISTIDYKVDQITNRVLVELTPWTSVSMVDITNDVYLLDYTLTGVALTAKVAFTFRITDADGLEHYETFNDFKILT